MEGECERKGSEYEYKETGRWCERVGGDRERYRRDIEEGEVRVRRRE